MEDAVKPYNAFTEVMFKQNTWANVRLLEACEALSEEQLGANVPGTYGTIRDTLVHIVGAEVDYVSRVTREWPGPPPEEGTFPGFELLKRDALWAGEYLHRIAQGAGPDHLVVETWEDLEWRYTLTGLLMQAINHSTEHRAQIATILTQQGVEPPAITGWDYLKEHGLYTEPENQPTT